VGLVRNTILSKNLEIVSERGTFQNIDTVQDNLGDGVVYGSNSVDVVRTGGYPNVFLKTQGVQLFYDEVYRVEVTISTTLQGLVCGLCGTYNDNTSVDEFGDSWLVPDLITVGCERRRKEKKKFSHCSRGFH